MAEPRTRTTIGVRHVRRVALKCRMLQKGRDHDHRHASGGSGLPLLNLFWTMFELFLSVLLFRIIIDIFRSQDLGGWGKSLWLIFVIVLPFLRVLIYLVARGGSMAQRDVRQAQEADAATRRHIQSAAGTSTSTAKQFDEAGRLARPVGSNISADDVVGSGGLPVFVDEAAEDRLSDDA
jgi:hypothetical protein